MQHIPSPVTHMRHVDHHRNPLLLEMFPRPDAGEHEQLGGPEDTATQDDFGRALRQSQLAHPRSNAPPTRHGLQHLDPDRAPTFDDYAGHRRVVLDTQVRHGRDGFDERRPRRLPFAAFSRRPLHRAASEAFPRPGRLVAVAALCWGRSLHAYLFEHAIARRWHRARWRKFFKSQLVLCRSEARLRNEIGRAMDVSKTKKKRFACEVEDSDESHRL